MRLERLQDGFFPEPYKTYRIFEIDDGEWFEMSFRSKTFAEDYVKARPDREFIIKEM